MASIAMNGQNEFQLEDKFDEFMRACYADVVAHSTQYRESRRIFHAGATVVYFQLLALTALSDDEGVARMEDLRKQLDTFFDMAGEDKD
jgi:hypothetical protein